jgi:hypothetical protein
MIPCQSIFGITNFDVAPDDWRFAVIMVGICVPFFLLTLLLLTRKGMELLKKMFKLTRQLVQTDPDNIRQLLNQGPLHNNQQSQSTPPVGGRRGALRRLTSFSVRTGSGLDDPLRPPGSPWSLLGKKRRREFDLEAQKVEESQIS